MPISWQDFWEMYLAVTLTERGLLLNRGGEAGPDFLCLLAEHRFWVEAVVPEVGHGPDGVPEHEVGVVYDVPVRQILLRLTNSVAQRKGQYAAALQKGLVAKDEAFVLAINSRLAADGRPGNTLPFFVQALLPFGNLTVVLDRDTRQTVDSFYERRESVSKSSGAAVNTAVFLDPEYAFISAVLHSMVDCVNRPKELGGDFQVLHNPMANRPLDPSIFSWCDQFTYENGTLKRTAG